MNNRYPGTCHACGAEVRAQAGTLERRGRRWVVWCQPCYNRSDNSSAEDRQCGNRAYEDACARACGMDPEAPSSDW